jgi:CIC family chloride channel protein
VVLGLVGGAAAFGVVRLVGLISNLALLHKVGFDLPNLRHYHPTPVLIPVALGGALVVSLLARWAPVIKGHGIPESLEAIVLRESRIKPRVLLAKPLSAAVAMGTGGPFGAEGPIIVTGGTIGSLLGQILPVSAAERRILLATGAAAGMAGVFSTPIAAVLLAFELLLFERSLRALLPLLLATGVAAEIHVLLLGSHPLFAVTRDLAVPAAQLPLFLALGVAVGLLAVILNKGLFAFEGGFGRLPIPEFFHPLVGALAFALIGLAVPGSLSVGYWAITDSVNSRFLAGAAALLFVTKLFSWWISLASNTSGGTLAPMFLIGATMGEMMGIGLAHLFPAAHINPGAFALVAMGATFGVAARALLTGGVFALEVTGAYHLAIPMLLVLGMAELVAEQLISERIMTDKLFRRGFRVEFDTETDPFRTVVAGQAMDPLPVGRPVTSGPCVDRTSYVRDALVLFLATDIDSVVVTDKGEPVGILARARMTEVLAKRLRESEPQPPSLRWPRRADRAPSLDKSHDGEETGESAQDEPGPDRM